MTFESPNPDEMQMYGFDPSKEEDVIAFQATDPANPDAPADYSQDAFEFGSTGEHPVVSVDPDQN